MQDYPRSNMLATFKIKKFKDGEREPYEVTEITEQITSEQALLLFGVGAHTEIGGDIHANDQCR